MLSSKSGKKASPFEFCQVYRALGVKNAIRLDGGPSAALYFNEEHLNPIIDDFNRIKFGAARKILYVLYVK
jgi:exopolysaccharide biosynthesis protein